MSDHKTMSVKEFRERGYLQEVNRQFLHPLGLALEVTVNDDGTESFSNSVWDYRDDPEGIIYAGAGTIDPHKVAEVNGVGAAEKRRVREERFGWVVQPPF